MPAILIWIILCLDEFWSVFICAAIVGACVDCDNSKVNFAREISQNDGFWLDLELEDSMGLTKRTVWGGFQGDVFVRNPQRRAFVVIPDDMAGVLPRFVDKLFEDDVLFCVGTGQFSKGLHFRVIQYII